MYLDMSMKQEPKIIYHLENNSPEIIVRSVEKGYREIKFVVTGDLLFRRHTFFNLFFPSSSLPLPDDITSRKKRIVQETIANIFNDFMDMAIHTPHKGKKAWIKERRKWIENLDPEKKYQVWEILDNVFSQVN